KSCGKSRCNNYLCCSRGCGRQHCSVWSQKWDTPTSRRNRYACCFIVSQLCSKFERPTTQNYTERIHAMHALQDAEYMRLRDQMVSRAETLGPTIRISFVACCSSD